MTQNGGMELCIFFLFRKIEQMKEKKHKYGTKLNQNSPLINRINSISKTIHPRKKGEKKTVHMHKFIEIEIQKT